MPGEELFILHQGFSMVPDHCQGRLHFMGGIGAEFLEHLVIMLDTLRHLIQTGIQETEFRNIFFGQMKRLLAELKMPYVLYCAVKRLPEPLDNDAVDKITCQQYKFYHTG